MPAGHSVWWYYCSLATLTLETCNSGDAATLIVKTFPANSVARSSTLPVAFKKSKPNSQSFLLEQQRLFAGESDPKIRMEHYATFYP